MSDRRPPLAAAISRYSSASPYAQRHADSVSPATTVRVLTIMDLPFGCTWSAVALADGSGRLVTMARGAAPPCAISRRKLGDVPARATAVPVGLLQHRPHTECSAQTLGQRGSGARVGQVAKSDIATFQPAVRRCSNTSAMDLGARRVTIITQFDCGGFAPGGRCAGWSGWSTKPGGMPWAAARSLV